MLNILRYLFLRLAKLLQSPVQDFRSQLHRALKLRNVITIYVPMLAAADLTAVHLIILDNLYAIRIINFCS